MCCCCCKKQIKKLQRDIAAIRFLLSRPGRMGIRFIKEENGMLSFVVVLPAPGAADVVTRELSVTIAGGTPVVINPAVYAIESQEFSGNDNDSVHLELVDVDDAGNLSTTSVLDTILIDTLAPPQPGEMGIRVTRED